MMATNLKRAALALLLATAWAKPASAQVEGQIEVVVDANVQIPRPAPLQTGNPAAAQAFKAEGLSWNIQVPSPYWIGVEGQPLDAAMRTALELPEQHGILVARVTADSPAAKAGLQAGDVLLQWCDAEKKCEPIESVEHLVKLVQETASKQPDQTITLEYRRRGKSEPWNSSSQARGSGAELCLQN